jgi:hypothetical protein
MTANNLNIADIFEQIADILDIQGGNFFRIRAYRQGARQLRGMPVDIAQYVENGQDLSKLPTIGHNLAAKIIEILETGHCATLTRLQKQSPPGLVELLHIPGLGPKRVHALYHELGVHTPEQALRAMDSLHFTLLAHPTGRLLETREAYDVDMSRIIHQAKQRGCYLELNAQPMRLDLSALHCQMAKAKGKNPP